MNQKTIIFCCNWSSFPGMKLSKMCFEGLDTSYQIIVNMCSGRVSPELILEAFKNGAWGVMLTACPEDQCEHSGNFKTCGRIALLKNMLPCLGIDAERLRLEWIDKEEVAKFSKAVETFVGDIKALGPTRAMT